MPKDFNFPIVRDFFKNWKLQNDWHFVSCFQKRLHRFYSKLFEIFNLGSIPGTEKIKKFQVQILIKLQFGFWQFSSFFIANIFH
jgi:hypothetical protein